MKIDVNELPEDNPYRKAVEFGITRGREETQFKGLVGIPEQELMVQVAYWTAWRAARNAAHAMLNAAESMGMRTEDLAVLQKVAEEVAYD